MKSILTLSIIVIGFLGFSCNTLIQDVNEQQADIEIQYDSIRIVKAEDLLLLNIPDYSVQLIPE
jgi:hypothetical protein